MTNHSVRTFLGLEPGEAFPRYADGGYPIVYYSADGSEWCADCANQTDADPPITLVDTYLEGPGIFCDGGCGHIIYSAYGDPETGEDDPECECRRCKQRAACA